MASTINQQFKITKFAKDLGMKSKDLVALLAQNGIEAKTTQKALEPLEFDILFESLTQANQITDIGSYLDGVTYIPSKPKKAEKEEKDAQVKAPEAPKKEEKAEKAEKVEKPAEKKVAAPKSAPAPAPKAKEEAPAARPQNVAEKKVEEKKEEKKEEKQAPVVPAASATPTKEAAPAARPAARQPYTGNPYRPQQNGAAGINVKQAPAQPAARPASPARAQQGQQSAFGCYQPPRVP